MSALVRFLSFLCLVALLVAGVGFSYIFVAKAADVVGGETLASDAFASLENAPTQSTRIMDRQGNLLYEVGAVNRQTVTIDEVPDHVSNAFLAAEDKTFYTNPGFSVRSIIRAAHTDVMHDQLLQGGSTITQQLAQQLVVAKESSVSRKIREVMVAAALTQKYPKRTILERYLNEAPVGGDLIGVGTAAKTYFGIPADQLTIAQGAYLAALINAPSTLDPYVNKAGLTERQHLVLDRMVEAAFISKDQADTAKLEVVSFLPRQTIIEHPFFSFYVKQVLVDEFGQQAVNEGLNVTTTLDPDLQTQAEQMVATRVAKNATDWQASNAALISAQPQTGQIVAYVGGADFNTSQVDILSSNRQPGSTIKPLTYYSAFANGYSPDTYTPDWVEDFGGGYRPTDYGGSASGRLVNLKTALAASLNIPAVHVLRGVGIQTATVNMAKMGFPIIKGYNYTLPLGLGAVEVTPYDMAQSYSTLANGGYEVRLSPLLKVTDRHGNVLLDNTNNHASKQVLDTNAVATVNGVISDYTLKRSIYAGDYFKNYTLQDRPAAAKTGTSSGPKDTWTIGYTPDLLTAVWAGNNSGANLKGSADGINVAAPLWHEFMTYATKDMPIVSFPTFEKVTLDQDHKYIDYKVSTKSTPAPSPSATPLVPTPTP